MNHSVENSPLLRFKPQLTVEKSIIPRFGHVAQPQDPEPLTAIKLLQYTHRCGEKLDIIFEAMGISFTSFNAKGVSPQKSSKPPKRFFNETTMNFAEKASVDLDLGCFHILNPFLMLIGTGGFNDHARSIWQY
jgi:hypothetical protein